MAHGQVIEGTGKELARYLNKQPEQRFRLVQLSEIEEKVEQTEEAKKDLTPEEKIQALNALAEKNRGLPVLPPEAFERESIYEDCL